MSREGSAGLNPLVRLALEQLYTTLACAYDRVAALASLGEWRAWGQVALEFLPERGQILELAHGPGHLYVELVRRGYQAVGLDRSTQMGRLLRRRSERALGRPAQQVRAEAQHLPFRDRAFDAVVCTFPTAFIFAPSTLDEVRRVLRPGGRCVVVPAAALTAEDVAARLVRALYQLTGQHRLDGAQARAVFEAAGYAFDEVLRRTPRAQVTVWVLTPAGR